MARTKKTKSPLDFVPTEEKGPACGAQWLDRAAKDFPYRPMPVTHIMKVTEKMAHMPRDGTQQVELFKKNVMPRIRRLLFQKYRRAFKFIYASGYRASVDDDDIIENYSGRNVRRLDGAVISLGDMMSLVDRKKLRRRENKNRYDEINKGLKVLQPAAHNLRLTADTEKK